ncbi:LCP family protein [Streptomyces melanogenes]|uniref:LCP family protein n=1 Tax=Streptomyces melanogenes TaxID=67326 RepID=A0ABZ1XLN9_9ACTN|nr:LCP family protein [Streptomyces melanogenes]
MDADVTDSPPPAPDHRAEDEPRPDTPTPPEPAGPTEAGTTDAGPKEAGPTEAGSKEAGPTEAGSTEADAAGPVEGESDTPDGPNARRHWLRWTALGVSFLVLAAAGTGWWFYKKLDNNIRTDTTAAAELERYEKERPPPGADNAQNLLLIGSDSRAGSNSRYGRDDGGSQRSDTTILLHLAADRKSATAVSLPRDLMADVPDCLKQDGTRTKARFAQFNEAFEVGGAACTIRTVEKLSGIRVDHHMVVDFSGFKDMVDAVDGVEVCLKEPVDDRQAHLKLPAGRQTLHGEQALGFVRARHGFGDGSDTERMDRQQQFLGSLVRKVQSNGVLLNPTRLYPVLDAMTKSLTTDPGLNSLKDLYDLVRGMRGIPTDKVQFLTVPRRPYTYDTNRDELVQPAARQLFQQLRDDQPLQVAPASAVEKAKESGAPTPSDSPSSDDKPDDPVSPSPAPTYPGSNAAVGMCG